jgi:hypothetical protein
MLLLTIHYIEYFFTGNISPYLDLTVVLMSSYHFANSEAHNVKARWL